MFFSLLYLLNSHCCVEPKRIRDHGMVTWPILQTKCREKTDNSRTHTPIGTVLKTVQSKQTDIELWTLYKKCDCSSRAHTWYTPSRWYTPGKFWYTLGCTIHPVDKHWFKPIEHSSKNLGPSENSPPLWCPKLVTLLAHINSKQRGRLSNLKICESNFVHHYFVQLGEQHSRHKAILPSTVLSQQQCCEVSSLLQCRTRNETWLPNK